eukprot:CAMPEP_0182545004 /NCGR_PEP_ID=MMETSP1323-20130603/33972_1 /TAXON_ID=236787 /ORGANISM="Florenciella parvula, Strain RCC1693" /LENGTH=59 /DNA_ID=CAMNT_0024756115 /DNA_START=84 /DNA_END=259 /DNA_ORIENTATION=+
MAAFSGKDESDMIEAIMADLAEIPLLPTTTTTTATTGEGEGGAGAEGEGEGEDGAAGGG